VRWAGLAAEIVLIAAFFFLGSVAFSRRDIAK
jgi:hypothetical protein